MYKARMQELLAGFGERFSPPSRSNTKNVDGEIIDSIFSGGVGIDILYGISVHDIPVDFAQEMLDSDFDSDFDSDEWEVGSD